MGCINMIFQENMTINIRSQKEWEAFLEVGTKEGLIWELWGDGKLCERQIEFISVYINNYKRVLTTNLDYKANDYTKVVEAADIFHNYIISMRLKGG